MLVVVVCISSLWSLIQWTWTKLPEQYRNIVEQESMFPFISCRSEADQKNINSTQEESQNWQWSEAGAIPPDFMSTSSETHGELDPDERARKAGL